MTTKMRERKKEEENEKGRTRQGLSQNHRQIRNEGRFLREVQAKGQISLSAIPPGGAAKKAKNALVRDVRHTHSPPRRRSWGNRDLSSPSAFFFPSSMQANHSRHRRDNRKGQEQRPIVIAKWLTIWGVFARPNELNA